MTEFADESICIVLGTRPEIVKLSEIVGLLGPAAFVVHTGQHYDPALSDVFFADLDLPAPNLHLGIGGETRGQQIGGAVAQLDQILRDRTPEAVVVQGDTNTTAAAAIAANANEIRCVHVEAGLRSHDRRMPEEHNRVITDHLADLLLAPTEVARTNLLAEAIADERIVVTGNTVVEAVERLMPDASERRSLVARLSQQSGEFVLATFHRPENVDDPTTFGAILENLAAIPLPVILPLHPRSVERADRFGLAPLLDHLIVTEPIGFPEFIGLGAESAFLVSDSGGVQEEVSVYKRPVIVVRRSTERPEVIGTFAERIEPGDGIVAIAKDWLGRLDAIHSELAALPSPYGDGTASERSVEAIAAMVGSERSPIGS